MFYFVNLHMDLWDVWDLILCIDVIRFLKNVCVNMHNVSYPPICFSRKCFNFSLGLTTTTIEHKTVLDILHNLMFICWFKNIHLHIFIFYSQVAWSIKTSWLEILVAGLRSSSYCLVATLLRYVKICRHNVNGQEYNPDFDMSSCLYTFPKFILHKFLTMSVPV